jgi:threonine synthase
MTFTLGEGNTPLLPAPRLSARFGVELWLKFDGANPTGSFKDRGMVVAVGRALESGATGVVCASTGNTAASAAAYGARAGLPVVILHPKGAVSRGKVAQALAMGADVRAVDGSFEDCHRMARELAANEGFVNVNSINPDRIEGQSGAAREIVEQLGGRLPDVLALPYGGGGNTVAYTKGFDDLGQGLPRLVPVQAEKRGETFATAIRIASPVHREHAEAAVGRSGGMIATVTEEQIHEAWRAVALEEGVFCEPASAAGVAAVAAVDFEPGTTVVAVLTGHGLKDPDAVERL